MTNKNNSTSHGISVFGLGVAFVVLKLCKVINWSWWWVTAPFWVFAALFIILLVLSILFD
ncbi:MAG: hypothetical protein K6F72_00280 [Bacteroidales bacterium]|nr:hypothetical protein [Bacteroidales bacterium]